MKKTKRKGIFEQQTLGFSLFEADCVFGSLLGWEGEIKGASTTVWGFLVSQLVQVGCQRTHRKIWVICHLVQACRLQLGVGSWKGGGRGDEDALSLISSPGPASLTEGLKKCMPLPLSSARDTFRFSLEMKEAAGIQKACFLTAGVQ